MQMGSTETMGTAAPWGSQVSLVSYTEGGGAGMAPRRAHVPSAPNFWVEGVRAGGIFLPVRPAGKPRAHPKSPEKQHLLGLHT